jgi:hypothetical protein
LACVALIAYAYPRPARGFSADSASRLGALRASSPATGATGATATACVEPSRRRRRTAQPERSQQGPIRTGINYVRVDAIVTDRQGNPVLDLKPEEFSLTEDNKPQKIEQFSVVKIDADTQMNAGTPTEIRSLSDEEVEAARPEAVVLLLDDYHVKRGNAWRPENRSSSSSEPALPAGHGRADVSAHSGYRASLLEGSRALINAVEHFPGRKSTMSRANVRGEHAYPPRPSRRFGTTSRWAR